MHRGAWTDAFRAVEMHRIDALCRLRHESDMVRRRSAFFGLLVLAACGGRTTLNGLPYEEAAGGKPTVGQPEPTRPSQPMASAGRGGGVAVQPTMPSAEGGAGGAVEEGAAGAGGDEGVLPPIVLNVTKEANEASFEPSLSSDGRWISFYSNATNLGSAGEPGGFVYDLASGSYRRVFSPATEPFPLYRPTRISTQGRFVVFASDRQLTLADTNVSADIFRVDLEQGLLQLVSKYPQQQAAGIYEFASSADGGIVAFQSSPEHVIFLRDMGANSARRVAPISNEEMWRPAVSADGTVVGFDTRARALTNDTGELHVFVEDVATREIELVSSNSQGTPANQQSFWPALSQDGRIVAFNSDAANLVPNDGNAWRDVFVKDLDSGQTTLVSVSSLGAQANASSFQPAISADGRYVAFLSHASNLAPGDDNGLIDVYVHDRVTKTTKRVSVDETGTHGAGLACNDAYFECPSPVLSAEGDVVVFASNAGDLVPGSVPGRLDVYRVEWQRLPP